MNKEDSSILNLFNSYVLIIIIFKEGSMNLERIFEEILKENNAKKLSTAINLAIRDWFIENHPKCSFNKAKTLIDKALNRINLTWLEDFYSETGLGYMNKTYDY